MKKWNEDMKNEDSPYRVNAQEPKISLMQEMRQNTDLARNKEHGVTIEIVNEIYPVIIQDIKTRAELGYYNILIHRDFISDFEIRGIEASELRGFDFNRISECLKIRLEEEEFNVVNCSRDIEIAWNHPPDEEKSNFFQHPIFGVLVASAVILGVGVLLFLTIR